MFKLEINTGTDAFKAGQPSEVSKILGGVRLRLLAGDKSAQCVDNNGLVVGSWTLETGKKAARPSQWVDTVIRDLEADTRKAKARCGLINEELTGSENTTINRIMARLDAVTDLVNALMDKRTGCEK